MVLLEVMEVVEAQLEDFELLLDDLKEHVPLEGYEIVIDDVPHTVKSF